MILHSEIYCLNAILEMEFDNVLNATMCYLFNFFARACRLNIKNAMILTIPDDSL